MKQFLPILLLICYSFAISIKETEMCDIFEDGPSDVEQLFTGEEITGSNTTKKADSKKKKLKWK